MPRLTRWFLRAAMVNLGLAFVLGLLTVLPPLADEAAAWRPAYIHLIALGWATQMIFGVAYWMFPRRGPVDAQRAPRAGWLCFGALNLGLLARVASEPLLAMRPTPAAQGLAVVAAVLQLTAVLAFTWIAWPRVLAR